MPKQIVMGPATVIWTNRADHNLGHNPPRRPHDNVCCGAEAEARRRAVHEREWLYLTQVHGSDVVVADDGIVRSGIVADAAVTRHANVPLGIATADCAPVALSSPEGVVGAVHAGWRGLQSGVISRTAAIMRQLGATDITAAMGPCIHVECYAFGEQELRPMVALWGEVVRGQTANGLTAFDLPAAVLEACKAVDVELSHVDPACTSCNTSYFSFRARQDEGRQVMVVWRDGSRGDWRDGSRTGG